MTQEEIDQEADASWRMLLNSLREQGCDIKEVTFEDTKSGNTFTMSWEHLNKPGGIGLLLKTMRSMRGMRMKS